MIQYFLAVILVLPNPRAPAEQHQYGPFHGLIACESAASQMRIAALAAHVGARVGTACLRQKHMNFKYKEAR
jgi:hypothetical protein